MRLSFRHSISQNHCFVRIQRRETICAIASIFFLCLCVPNETHPQHSGNVTTLYLLLLFHRIAKSIPINWVVSCQNSITIQSHLQMHMAILLKQCIVNNWWFCFAFRLDFQKIRINRDQSQYEYRRNTFTQLVDLTNWISIRIPAKWTVKTITIPVICERIETTQLKRWTQKKVSANQFYLEFHTAPNIPCGCCVLPSYCDIFQQISL